MTCVLDLDKPHHCAVSDSPCYGRGPAVCSHCRRNDPPGCSLREQNGVAYGWSNGNVQYERVGMFNKSAMRRLVEAGGKL